MLILQAESGRNVGRVWWYGITGETVFVCGMPGIMLSGRTRRVMERGEKAFFF